MKRYCVVLAISAICLGSKESFAQAPAYGTSTPDSTPASIYNSNPQPSAPYQTPQPGLPAAPQPAVLPPGSVPNNNPQTSERPYLQQHPMLKSGLVGAGIGGAAGGITSLITGHGLLHGAVIGAGTGAGIGMLRKTEFMAEHPILRNTATGGLAGLGLGLSATRHEHGLVAGTTTAIGATVGLGYGLLKNAIP